MHMHTYTNAHTHNTHTHTCTHMHIADNYNSLSLDICQAKYHVCQTIMRYGLTLSDQIIRREPKGLSCIGLVDYESDHDLRSIMCMV